MRKRKQISEPKKTKPKVLRGTFGVSSCHKSLFDIPNEDKTYNGNYNSDNDFINLKPKSQNEKSASTSTSTSASASTSASTSTSTSASAPTSKSHQNFETNDTGNVDLTLLYNSGRMNISDGNFTTEYKNNQKKSLLYSSNHIFDKYLTEGNDELNPENILDPALSQEGIYILYKYTN